MKPLASFVAIALAACFSSVVFAHGGHGVTVPASMLHFLLEPLHLMPAVVVLVVAVAAVRTMWRKAK